MQRFTLFLLSLFTLTCALSAQDSLSVKPDNVENKYRRSSLFSVLVKHSGYSYSEEIDSAFMVMPVPDKFNDHNIHPRSFESSAAKMNRKGKQKTDVNIKDAENFLVENRISANLVAKWFDRDSVDGGFDMALIQERGFYDASQLDIANANATMRGVSALGDAGEELIGNTFVIINDITFVDKGEKSKTAAGIFSLLGSIASVATGDNSYAKAGASVAVLTNEIDGFRVDITSYLYRLVWNDETSGTFYQEYWFPAGTLDPQKRAAFDASDLFRVEYIGQTSTSAGNFSLKSSSSSSKSEQMLTVCARAVDRSIVQLQRSYDEFKVKVPLYKVNGDGTVDVQIGLKEGITSNSKFEVLVRVEDIDGSISYQRVGMIQPVEGRIWDNRFGALQEAEAVQLAAESGDSKAKDAKSDDGQKISVEAAKLSATTFRILNGANKITEGCFVKEVSF